MLRRERKVERKARRSLIAWRMINMQEEVDDYGLQELRREEGCHSHGSQMAGREDKKRRTS